ncbi:hypothetical protein HBH71_000180 [Parastagonospora nodorum]|nr:hypothetical protein HBH71_000180 [Parastagonospora nodorum]
MRTFSRNFLIRYSSVGTSTDSPRQARMSTEITPEAIRDIAALDDNGEVPGVLISRSWAHPTFLSLETHNPAHYHNQFLRENAESRREAYDVIHLRMVTTARRRMQVERGYRESRETMSGKTMRKEIKDSLPYIPVEILDRMSKKHSVLCTKFFSISSSIQPDFTIVQLLTFGFWRVGPVATVDELENAIIELFPWYNRVRKNEKRVHGRVLFYSKDCFEREFRTRIVQDIATHIKRILGFSTSCHEPLFTHTHVVDQYGMVPGYEKELFPHFGLKNTESLSMQHQPGQPIDFNDLPREIHQMVFEKLYECGPLNGGYSWRQHHGSQEPLLSYRGPPGSITETTDVHLPDLGRLLWPSLVSRHFCYMVRDTFPKKVTFNLDERDSSLPDLPEWLRGVHPMYHTFLWNLSITFDFSDGRKRPRIDGCYSTRRRCTLLRSIGKLSTLRTIDIVFDFRRFNMADIQALKVVFQDQWEINVLCRFKGIRVSTSVRWTDTTTGRCVSSIQRDENGKDILDDQFDWLKRCMGKTKNRMLPCPAITPKPRAVSTIKGWTNGKIALAAIPYGGISVGLTNKKQRAEWLARQMEDDYRNPGEP